MKKIFILFILFLFVKNLLAQTDSLPNAKRKFMPAIKIGGNYVGFFTGEAGFLFGMTRKNLHEASKVTSTTCHGPAISCEIGKPGNDLLIAPKLSYEYYSIFYGARISVVDYMNGSTHNIYICPEAGISGGASFTIFAGANIPVSGGIGEVKTFRASLVINLFSYLFKKDKSKN
ncbi:MAG: hypothetical protein HY063_15135 [Bacteroidetes bacterium]|nr:hypothetical protein [Bacteroidota bacterium]